MAEMLTIRQVKEKWKLSNQLIYNLIKQPGFPVCRVGRKKVLIPADKLQIWIDNGGIN